MNVGFARLGEEECESCDLQIKHFKEFHPKSKITRSTSVEVDEDVVERSTSVEVDEDVVERSTSVEVDEDVVERSTSVEVDEDVVELLAEMIDEIAEKD